MGNIPIDHAGCNGWAIYDKQYIDADDAKNKHIVEGIIDENGIFHPNPKLETICGRKLRSGRREYRNPFQTPSEMRSSLAELQNAGGEICGGCVARFYADPKQP